MIKNRTITISIAILFLIMAGIFAILKEKSDPTTDPTEPKPAKVADVESGASSSDTDKKNTVRHMRDKPRNPELVAKYGESRVNFARHITGNLMAMMDDMTEIIGSPPLTNLKLSDTNAVINKLGAAATSLNLTDDQKSKVANLLAERDKRKMQEFKDRVEKLKKDPTPLMTMMLASDARSRGEMDEAEYKRSESEITMPLSGLINPMNAASLDQGKPLEDKAFSRDFNAILSSEQATQLQSAIANQASLDETITPKLDTLTNIPVMTLEKLDTTIESTKKLTDGLKGLMEGVGGLQNLQPLLKVKKN